MKSNLEVLCESITVEVCGSSIDDIQAGKNQYGFDVNNFVKILEVIGQVITELVANCPNKAGLRDSVRKPSFLQRVKLRHAVKDACDMSGINKVRLASGRIADACVSAATRLSDEEIEKLISEIENTDNLII
jgi:hypothetical protein